MKWRLWNPIKNIFIPYEHKTGKDECLLFLSCEKIKFFTWYSADVIPRKNGLCVTNSLFFFSLKFWTFKPTEIAPPQCTPEIFDSDVRLNSTFCVRQHIMLYYKYVCIWIYFSLLKNLGQPIYSKLIFNTTYIA